MASHPIRLQLSRAKGFDLQALSLATNGLPAAKVDRSTPWGNPWRLGDVYPPNAAELVDRFRRSVIGPVLAGRQCAPDAHPESTIGKIISGAPKHLRGKNLACWCALKAPCHADVLLEIANRPICEAI